jgi:predicted  nucleic acid-binding Zn-ribbon protein
MGPTNVALVKLFQADQQLRAAQAELDAASKNVRVQKRRVDDLTERHRLAQSTLMENKSQANNVELDLKTRDEHIEKLRSQQQNAKNNKEYQTFLIEINTEKVDKSKIEDELMKYMEQVETGQKEVADLSTQLQVEQAKLTTMQQESGAKLAGLQEEIDALRVPRDEAYNAVPAKARDMFERLAERHEGEALSAISKPDRRREEYICSACNMDLVIDVYNKLHSRDELVFCPNCRRILYIPEDLPPEAAVHKKKPVKAKKIPDSEIGAAAPRQQSAVDVLNSLQPDSPDEASESSDVPESSDSTAHSSPQN